MNKFSRSIILIALLSLTLSTFSCGAFAAAQATEPPTQSAPTELPVIAPAQSSTDPNATVPCSQLFAPNDIKLLLNNVEPSNLSENANAGGTICTWQYLPNGSSETHIFYLEVNFSADAAAAWKIKHQAELAQEPTDIAVNSIHGLADESYVWSSKATGFYVVYARQGDKVLIMRYIPQDVLYMANESGIIDMANRIFNRF